MKAKLDENLGNRAIDLFVASGHDVATVNGQNLGGVDDEELIEACRTEGRTLVTLDLDFPNVLRFPPREYTGIAVLRVPHPIELDAIRQRIRILLQAIGNEDLSGRLWIVEQDRIREYDPE
ncbi:MAG: DUF5615 family PIN-like protein [Rubrobacteraceae bacterium]